MSFQLFHADEKLEVLVLRLISSTRWDDRKYNQLRKPVWSILHSKLRAHALTPLIGNNKRRKRRNRTQSHNTDTDHTLYTNTHMHVHTHTNTHTHIHLVPWMRGSRPKTGPSWDLIKLPANLKKLVTALCSTAQLSQRYF